MILDNLISDEYSLLYSKDTGDLYISENREVFLLDNKKIAEGMKEFAENAKTEARPCKLSDRKLTDMAYELGATGIRIYGKGRITIEAQPKRVKYANPELKFSYARLLITGEQKYLERLGVCHFIVPADLSVLSGSKVKKQLLMYPAAAPNENNADREKLPVYYLVFTDLSTFNEWNRQQGGYWRPLELQFWQLREVYGESGICVNYGFSDCSYIEPEILAKIPCDVPDMGITIIDEEDLPA